MKKQKSIKVQKKYITLLVATFMIFGFLGVAWGANSLGNDEGFSKDGTKMNSTGVYVDTNSKLTTDTTVSIGTGSDSDFVYSGGSVNRLINNATNVINASSTGGSLYVAEGNYTMGTGQVFFSRLTNTDGHLWFKGSGYSTIFSSNSSSSAFFTLGNDENPPIKYMRFSDMKLVGGNNGTANTSARLLNGNPSASANYHKYIFIDNVIGEETHSRFINLDADYLFIERVLASGGCGGYGGQGNFHWLRGNAFKCPGTTSSETEGIDDNSQAFSYSWISDNFIENFYEQGIDASHKFTHLTDNTVIVAVPTDQGGITVANDFNTIIGNIAINISNTRGGIEWHDISDYATILGNVLITNDTNLSNGGYNDTDNTGARCMRLDGNNATVIGNVFLGCETPFQGSTGNENQLIGNWFEPDVSLDERYLGMNLVNGVWKTQGANSLFTKNVTVNHTLVQQTGRKHCFDGDTCATFIQNNGTGLVIQG